MKNLLYSIREFLQTDQEESTLEELGIPNPQEIVKELDQYIIGQYRAKKSLALLALNRALMLLNTEHLIELEEPIQKANIIMLGPTGSGKTALIRAFSEIMGIPIIIFDVSSITPAGWYGSNLTDMFNQHIDACYTWAEANKQLFDGYSPEYFVKRIIETGIIYIDEIDKISCSVSEDKVKYLNGMLQNELLQIMEGNSINLIPDDQYKKNKTSLNRLSINSINTKEMHFILGGAFSGLEEIIERRLNKKNTIGFKGSLKDSKSTKGSMFQSVNNEDLVKYGFKPEFLGRIPLRAILDHHTTSSLIEILKNSKHSVYKQYKGLFKTFNVDLVISMTGLKEIAETSLNLGLGARALTGIFNSIFEDTLFNIFDYKKDRLIVDRKYIKSKLKNKVNGL